MGVLRIFRRLQEKRGKAIRKQYYRINDGELKGLPDHLIEKANLTGDYRWNVTEWRER